MHVIDVSATVLFSGLSDLAEVIQLGSCDLCHTSLLLLGFDHLNVLTFKRNDNGLIIQVHQWQFKFQL